MNLKKRKLIIYCENKEFKKFVKEAYKIVSKAMNIDLKYFPHLIQINLLNEIKNNKRFEMKLEVFRDFLNKIRKGFGNKIINNYYGNKLLMKDGEKLNQPNELFKIIEEQTVGAFIRTDINYIFIPEGKISTLKLGEELFHFVHHYYKKRHVDSSIDEFFGFLGRSFLFELFKRDNNKFVKEFPNPIKQETVTERIAKKMKEFEKRFKDIKILRDKGYTMAYSLRKYPVLNLAIKNPEEFYNKKPKKIIKYFKKHSLKKRLV